jgi:hypothetical protein
VARGRPSESGTPPESRRERSPARVLPAGRSDMAHDTSPHNRTNRSDRDNPCEPTGMGKRQRSPQISCGKRVATDASPQWGSLGRMRGSLRFDSGLKRSAAVGVKDSEQTDSAAKHGQAGYAECFEFTVRTPASLTSFAVRAAEPDLEGSRCSARRFPADRAPAGRRRSGRGSALERQSLRSPAGR